VVLSFLLDENVPGRVVRALQRHNQRGADPLDIVRVGGSGSPPLSSDDSTILSWAEENRRLLVTEDKHTMPAHLDRHLKAGHHVPGVLMIRGGARVPALVEFLVLVAYASRPEEWEDRIEYIP
jgi:hypothetical protein